MLEQCKKEILNKIIRVKEFEISPTEKIWREFYDVSDLDEFEKLVLEQEGKLIFPTKKKGQWIIPISKVTKPREGGEQIEVLG